MKLVSNKRISIPLGFITASADALTNGFLVPPETEVLFNFRPGTWLLTFLVYTTLGELSALPLAVGVLQASEEISAKTGANVERINPGLGNIALLTAGVVFSIGFVNLIGSLWAHFRFKALGHESQKYFLQRRFLKSSRSVEEYQNYLDEPDKFLDDKCR